MKQAKVNLPIDRELYQRLQALSKEFSVPQSLLTKAILWQFVNNVETCPE